MRLYCLLIAIILLSLFYAAAETGCQTYDRVTNQVLPDSDCDVIPDNADNCPTVANPQQEDTNNDGVGDACETATSPPPSMPSTPPQTIPPQTAQPTFLDNLQIKYTTSYDLVAGGLGEFYSFSIRNTGDQPLVVTLDASDISPWGSYAIKPARTATIQPGKEEKIFLFVKADFSANPGEKHFAATLSSDGAKKTVDLYARVIVPLSDVTTPRPTIELVFISLAIVLLIIGLIIGYNRIKRGSNHE